MKTSGWHPDLAIQAVMALVAVLHNKGVIEDTDFIEQMRLASAAATIQGQPELASHIRQLIELMQQARER